MNICHYYIIYGAAAIMVIIIIMMDQKKLSQLSSSRASSAKTATRVLLVCVYDTVIVELTNDMIYNTFCTHGLVEKVLIFERGQITKLFVQFGKNEDTESIKNALDNSKVLGTFCKMHIFYSNLPEIDLKNKNTRGKDYSHMNSQKSVSSNSNTPLKKPPRKSSDDFEIDFTKQDAMGFGIFKSKTEGYELSKCVDEIHKMSEEDQEEDKTDLKIRWEIENILEQNEDELTPSRIKLEQEEVPEQTALQAILEKQKPTEILSFQFENKVTLLETYNLFSNYGNIDRIFLKNFTIFVQFSTVDFAVLAKQYLNNMVLFGNLLRMTYATPSQMVQKFKEYSESIMFDETYYRFSSTRSLSINPPSQTLHVSNLKKEVCNPERLKAIFEDMGKIEKVHFLPHNKERNMALVKFSTLQQSLKVVASMHNTLISGRKIQISFTKSKI